MPEHNGVHLNPVLAGAAQVLQYPSLAHLSVKILQVHERFFAILRRIAQLYRLIKLNVVRYCEPVFYRADKVGLGSLEYLNHAAGKAGRSLWRRPFALPQSK